MHRACFPGTAGAVGPLGFLQAQDGCDQHQSGTGSCQPIFPSSTAVAGRDLPSLGYTRAEHTGAAGNWGPSPVFPTFLIQKSPINQRIVGWFGLERPLKPILFPSPALGRDTSHVPRLLQAPSSLNQYWLAAQITLTLNSCSSSSSSFSLLPEDLSPTLAH